MADYVSLKQLAAELGLDRSNARKYIISQRFTFYRVRMPDSGNQLANVLTLEDAEAVKQLRREQGFGDTRAVQNGEAWFYIVQLIPEYNPNRIKLGIASDVEQRLQAHRTASPLACLLKVWPCKQSWERAAIDSITRTGCTRIGPEVFECDDIGALRERGDRFFALMPSMDTAG